MVVAILAGNYRQYRHWLKEHEPPNPKSYRYIFTETSVLGIRFDSYLIVGTYWSRRDAGRMYDAVRLSLKEAV